MAQEFPSNGIQILRILQSGEVVAPLTRHDLAGQLCYDYVKVDSWPVWCMKGESFPLDGAVVGCYWA